MLCEEECIEGRRRKRHEVKSLYISPARSDGGLDRSGSRQKQADLRIRSVGLADVCGKAQGAGEEAGKTLWFGMRNCPLVSQLGLMPELLFTSFFLLVAAELKPKATASHLPQPLNLQLPVLDFGTARAPLKPWTSDCSGYRFSEQSERRKSGLVFEDMQRVPPGKPGVR